MTEGVPSGTDRALSPFDGGPTVPLILSGLLAWVLVAMLGVFFGAPAGAEVPQDAVSIARYLANPFCVLILGAGLWALVYAAFQMSGLALDCRGRTARSMLWATGRSGSDLMSRLDTVAARHRADALAEIWERARYRRSLPLAFAVWLLPLLGFIGTVVGISGAIGELGGIFSEGTDRDAAILRVLGGLRFAFDTTFVGLALVVPVMAASSLLRAQSERVREDLLLSAMSHRDAP